MKCVNLSHQYLRQLKRKKTLKHHGCRFLGACLTECQDLVTSCLAWAWPGASLVHPEKDMKCLVSNTQPVGLAGPPSKPQGEMQLQPMCFHGASFTPCEEVLAASTNWGPQMDAFLKSGITNSIPRNYIGNKIARNLFLWTVAARSFAINPKVLLVSSIRTKLTIPPLYSFRKNNHRSFTLFQKKR